MNSGLTRFLYLLGPVFIITSHLGCLLLLATGLSLGALAWAAALYLVRMLATTAIYHRLITHRSYQAPRPVAWIGALVGASAGQMGPSWWKAHHLAHHRHVDTAEDPHSPLAPEQGWRGFWRSQAGWLLQPSFFPARLPADVEADPVLRLIDRLHVLPALALGWLSYGLGGWPFLAAYCLSTTVLFHGVATVNSVAHLAGDQPFRTQDHSRNNGWVALLTLGEGWHNLHHAFQASVRQGYTLDQGQVRRLPDPTYAFIRLLERFGLASRLILPSQADLLDRARRPERPTAPATTLARAGI
ncbi:acyl-CoA desaturase [Synechococcus sp. Tobar12-5m-g]|nr:acyl-CoA desaturase [Synechococcus sp. Tobar12-5m-g]MCP9872624.1 acyl-CoA desaturase [Synechococcus sp. Cruz CV-v-12]